MPIQAIDSDRLYRKIARQLSALIDAGELTPGQRLPAERELADQLGVSRPSVREALIALEIEGKVEVRVGTGVFVSTHKPSAAPPISDEGEGPFELIRAREVIEGETAALAAAEATADEVAQLRATIDELQRHARRGEPIDTPDRAFHTAIARATRNSVLASVVQMLWDQGRGTVWKMMEKHFETPALRAATVRDHTAVCDAIEAHDAEAARTAMQRHLTRVGREFARGWGREKPRARARSRSGRSSPGSRRA